MTPSTTDSSSGHPVRTNASATCGGLTNFMAASNSMNAAISPPITRPVHTRPEDTEAAWLLMTPIPIVDSIPVSPP